MNKILSVEVDRKITETEVEIRNDLHESKIELNSEIDRKITELRESN